MNGGMWMNKKACVGLWLFLLLCLALSILLSVGFGSVSISPYDAAVAIQHWAAGGEAVTPTDTILRDIRLPRTLFAALCGVGLSLTGLVLQTVTRNDLADPYVLGVSSGASTGAVGAIVGGWFGFLGNYGVPAGAFIGAAASTALVILCTGRSSNPIRLILIGMGISAFFSAATMLLIYNAQNESQVRSAMFWLLGSLSGMQWNALLGTAGAVGLCGVCLWFLRQDLDLMLLGEGEAEYLGMAVKHLQLAVVIISSVAVAVLVSKAGIIGFVGLIVPHMARAAAGPSHGRLILFSTVIGALVMVWADVLSRSLFAPEEVPVGVLTAFAGAPLFIWIVCRRYGSE